MEREKKEREICLEAVIIGLVPRLSLYLMNPELAFQPQLIIEDLSGKNLISCGRRREKKTTEA